MMRIVWLGVILMLCIVRCGAGAAEVHLADDSLLNPPAPFPPTLPPIRRLPVLFVHGHAIDFQLGSDNTTDDPANPNYKSNWWNSRDSLPSFKQTLDNPNNSLLDIEPYFIRFEDQTRSITEDAAEIQQAVDDIVRRHNPGFDTTAPSAPPPVQVVIIAYSKGTLSTRQYLKSLQVQVQDPGGVALLPPRPNYRPVSEFIAISPPNHGLATPLFRSTTKISVKQLYNGVTPPDLLGGGCGSAYGEAKADNFIEILNGETSLDTQVSTSAPAPNEAPGSRGSGLGPRDGILYVTLFATNNDDMIGGDTPSGDCRNRALASNLSADAINLTIAGISNDGQLLPNLRKAAVHANTPHTQDVICMALFAAIHHGSPAGQTCTRDGDIPVIPLPQPVATVLALDLSGSMLAPACNNCPSRLDVLKDAVELFVQLWSQMGRTSDRLGVTYFRTNVDQPQFNGDILPMLTSTNVAAILNHVRGQESLPTNLTAMGGALQRSVEALRALPVQDAVRRHVVLFSDGMQNVNPMVHEVAASPPQHDISDIAGHPASNVPPANPAMRLDLLSDPSDGLPDIRVNTIGVGAGAFLTLLDAIARQAQGFGRATINAEDLRQFFVEELINTLRGFSPQLIDYRRGSLSKTGAVESFLVNRGARKLLLKVSWPRGQALEIRAFRGGVDMTNEAQIAAGGFYRILAINFPPSGARDTERGEWQLRISGKTGTRYEAAAIVDEPQIRYRTRFGSIRNEVGSPLVLAVDVTADGRPIAGPVAVTATVTRPRIGIGNLLTSIRPLAVGKPGFEPGMSAAERRVAALVQDSRQWRNLGPSTQSIRLEGNSKGGFRAVFPNISVPGIYRVVVRLTGDDRQLGRFERIESATAIVRFAAADLAKSALRLREEPKTGALALTLRPADRRGNLLGPSFAAEVGLALSAGKISGPEDLGDGRYRFVLSLSKGEEPALTLAVAERLLFKGTVKELRAKLRR